MRRFAPLAILVAAYLLVGSLYAIYTPNWQAPDEPAHYNYIGQLAAGRFPVIEPGDYDQEFQSLVISSQFDPQYSVESFEYEDYQPPLYYILQTPVFLITGGSLSLMRLFSVFIGAGVVVLTYLVSRRLIPDNEWLALTAAAFVAFLPQHVAMMAAVNNDSLAELLIACILLLLLILIARNRGSQKEHLEENNKAVSDNDTNAGETVLLILLGILLGLGFLTKVTVYILVPIVALTLLWKYWGKWRSFLTSGLIVFGVALLIGLTWWVRNILVYGGLDVLGTQAHNAIVVGQPRTVDWLSQRGVGGTLVAFLQTSFQSFWGQFGWMGVVMPSWVYRPLFLFTLATSLGIVLAVYHSRRRNSNPPEDADWPTAALPQASIFILVGTIALSLFVYLAYNLTFVQHQGRYLFPALVPIGFGVAVAWSALLWPFIKRWPKFGYLLPAGLALSLLALDLIALFRFIVPSLS